MFPQLPTMTRQGQTNRKVGTQSHGPPWGSRATECRRPYRASSDGATWVPNPARTEPPFAFESPAGPGAGVTSPRSAEGLERTRINMSNWLQIGTTRRWDRPNLRDQRRKSRVRPFQATAAYATLRAVRIPECTVGPVGTGFHRIRGRRCEVELQMGTCSFDHYSTRALTGEEERYGFNPPGRPER